MSQLIDKKKLKIERDRKLFLKKCQTKEELKAWIKYFFGLQLPDVKVSRYADIAPFDVVWELYRICVLKQNPENIQELLYVASRGGGKTLAMAIAELMIVLHDQRDAIHVGAILSQAKRAYEYQQKFLMSRRVFPIVSDPDVPEDMRILEKSNMERSFFNIHGQKVTIEILPCTVKACNGPHGSFVSVDEIDTLDGEGLRAFREISGMLDSRGNKKALRVGISTRKSRFGIMNRLMENADKENRVVRKWTALEFTERCPDERSGTEFVPAFINLEKMEVLSKEKFDLLEPNKKRDYEETELRTGCMSCPIAAVCRGDAKKQTSTSPMLKTLDELIQKVRVEGPEWALSQLFNLKPSLEGVVFREYEEGVHVVTWESMYEILTGEKYPGQVTHDVFIQKCHEMSIPCYAGVDFGYSAPSTVVYVFVDRKENIYVVRTDGMQYMSQPAWIHYMRTKWQPIYRAQLYYPDMADQGAVAEMKKAGLPVASFKKDQVNAGIQTIKKWLRVPGGDSPKLFFAQETTKHIQNEFTLYHYKLDAAGIPSDIPEDENDHWIDALRYIVHGLFGGRNAAMMISDDEDTKLIKPQTSQNFNPLDLLRANGFYVPDQTPQNTKILGRVGTINELTQLEEEDETLFNQDNILFWDE